MATTVQQAASALARALGPLAYALEGSTADVAVLLARLGWELPTIPPSMLGLADTSRGLTASLGGLDVALEADTGTAGGDGSAAVAAALAELAADLAALATALGDLPAQLRAELPADVVAATGIDVQFEDRLFQTLVDEQIEHAQPLLAAVLQLLGLREVTAEDADPARFQPAFVRRTIHLDRIRRMLDDPAGLIRDLYGWGTPALNTGRLFDALLAVGFALGTPGHLRYPGHQVLEELSPGIDVTADAEHPQELVQPLFTVEGVGLALGLMPAPPAGPQPQALLATVLGTGALHGDIPITASTRLQVEADADLSTGLSLVLRPGQAPLARLALGGPGSSEFLTGRVAVRLNHTSGDATRPLRLLAISEGTRIEIQTVYIGLAVAAHGGPPELVATAGFEGGRFVLSPAGSDSFVSRLLPADGLTVNFDLGLAWSRHGLSFTGSGGTEIEIPTPVQLGPLLLRSLHLRLAVTGTGLTAEASVVGGAVLGPLTAIVDRVGAGADLAFQHGNLGPVDLGGHFKPPNGIGVSVDASVVRGGGYLFFDPQREQYAGVLHLEFEKLTLNAFGLLTTRLPDGSPGFSLLVVIQASGFTPIQLGFGFTLNGVGGLLGINRTVAVDVLRAGVKNRTLDSILFSPDDPVPRAPQIISTLQSVFPPAVNQYVFGPMALLGWGTPTLITIELAVILELPSPIRLIILGRVHAALPEADHAIVSINLDVVGIIDFDRSELSVDASLYDSRVGPFAISGDMAARVNWGENPNFAMALGGFHPAFTAPAGFPQLRRLAIALSTGDNPRLRMEAYFALTSNTVQAGARLELYVGFAGFALEGGLGFDTLIQFSPFRLLAEIFAHLALKRGSTTLLGLDIHVHLTGPAPWVLWGEATFKIFFFHFSIPFRAEFGRREDVPAIERTAVWPVLRDSLTADANWSAQLPAAGGRLVVLRDGAGTDELLAHPAGTLSVSQNLVPLERTLGLFGSAPPKDYDRFAITGAVGLTKAGATTQFFAPAQFRQMSDAEKLSSPAYERMVSGARLAPQNAGAVGYVQETPLDYEQSVILDVDQLDADRLTDRYTPAGETVSALAERGPAGTAAIRTQGPAKFAPPVPGPAVADPVYVLVTKDTLAPVPEDGTAGGYTAVAERLRRRPDRDELQVVRAEEVEAV
jgi:hypothetical protein